MASETSTVRITQNAPRPVQPARALTRLTILNGLLLGALWLVERFVAERHASTTLLTYLPQHGVLIPAIVLLLWSIARRQKRLMAANGAALIFGLCGIMGFNVPLSRALPRTPPANAVRLRVMSFNMLAGKAGAKRVGEVVRAQNPDVLCLQEAGGIGDQFWRDFETSVPGYFMVQGAETRIYSRFPIASSRETALPFAGGRVILQAVVKVRGQNITVVNVHFGTIDIRGRVPRNWQPLSVRLNQSIETRRDQARALWQQTQKVRGPMLVTGDFNTPPRGLLYRGMAARWQDSFRAAGWGFGHSFSARRPVVRIDYIWTTPQFRVLDCRVPNVVASDHLPVVADLELPSSQSTPALPIF